MKFATDIFPKGIFKGQMTDGAFIDETLAINLDILAKKIANDMHFLGIITGNDSVGNGKSTLAQQVGCYLTCKINELHKVNNTFTHKNVFFNSKELTKHSPELPPYSVICLDEGDDLTTHGMKELAVRLKRYFRKCRQLNQIILLILPSFFELPKFYALSRSHFLINVSFEGEYERGFFKFYGPLSKKLLYIKGKKEWDYSAHPRDFEGRFFSSYCFFPNLKEEVELYKKNKYQDMVDDSKEQEEDRTPAEITRAVKAQTRKELFLKLFKHLPQVKQKDWANFLEVDKKTIFQWKNEDISRDIEEEEGFRDKYSNNLKGQDNLEGAEQTEVNQSKPQVYNGLSDTETNINDENLGKQNENL